MAREQCRQRRQQKAKALQAAVAATGASAPGLPPAAPPGPVTEKACWKCQARSEPRSYDFTGQCATIASGTPTPHAAPEVL